MFQRLTALIVLTALMVGGGVMSAGPLAQAGYFDRMTLWNSGSTVLRGANLFQRIRHVEVDGPDFLGHDYIGPPYTQEDFDELAALGANYVNLSIPGLYTISPPYVFDAQAAANLDNLLAMAAKANMYAVISFRTGPGRSDFTFYRDGAGDWYDPSFLIETVWTDQAAQDEWVQMWHDTAERYKDNPIVAGYDLMVEPNPQALVEDYDPAHFFNNYGSTLYNWNNLEPRIIAAVRQVDTDTPILLESMGWNGLYWLQYTYMSSDPRVVYTAHNYEPFVYSNQDSNAGLTYPGVFDANGDGNDDTVNLAWQENWYTNTVDAFLALHHVPLAITELGVTRWAPGAETYLADQFSIIEARGLNHAIWMYHANWPPYKSGDSAFDFMVGPDPDHTQNVIYSALLGAISHDWAQNSTRPNMASPEDLAPSRNNITSSPVTLTWGPVTWATGYQVQIARSSGLSDSTYYSLPSNPASLTLPMPNGIFYWRVQARKSDGVTWGSWSGVESFVVSAPNP